MNGILCVGDIHLADKPPASCTEAYLDEQWAVTSEALEIAAKADLLPVFAGDIFHSKTPTRNSHQLVRKLIALCKSCPLQPRVVLGNHDIRHDVLSTISEQPLGVVLASGAMRMLDGQDSQYGFLWGAPWGQQPPSNMAHEELVVAHAAIYPPGKVPPWGGIDATDWAKKQRGGSCYYGHIHDPHGIYEVDHTVFCNNGAITRGALTEIERTREPVVTVWAPSVNESWAPYWFTPLTLKSPLPAEEVLRIVESEEVKKQRADAEDFLSRLSVSTHSSLAEAIDEIRKAEDVPEHVRALAIDLIDQVA